MQEGLTSAEADSPPSPGASQPPASGTRHPKVHYFGDYELLQEIACGGMGIVYKARQISLDRIVAVKMILAGQLASESAVKRFHTEAEAAAGLDHPNIVSIYEVGQHEGQHYFSMQFVDGPNLSQYVAGRPNRFSPQEAARLLVRVARAVHYAHQRGILHRDLKPANILMDVHGQPHVTDFGLAKLAEADSDLTLSGMLLGTPNFMSPEQAAGKAKALTTQTDIYGLGAVLYFLLTRHPPFEGATPLETMRKVAEEEPAPMQKRSAGMLECWTHAFVRRPPPLQDSTTPPLHAVDRDLETICLKCLEKDPTRRYASADALADDLEHWLRHEPIRARPCSRREHVAKWVKRNPALAGWAIAAVLAAVVGVAGIIWQWRRADRNAAREMRQRERVEATVVRLEMEQADSLFAQDRTAPAVAQLSRLLHRHPDNRVIAERLLSALSVLDASASSAASTTNLTTVDGRAVDRDQPLALDFVHPAPRSSRRESAPSSPPPRDQSGLTSAATGLQEPPTGIHWAEFSPQGQRVLTVSADCTVRVWDARTAQPVSKPMLHRDSVRLAHFSPDGTLVATAADASARVWDARTGEPLTPPLQHGDRVLEVRFSPDGRWIVTASADGTARVWEARTGQPVGHPLQHRQDPAAAAEKDEYAAEFGESADLEPTDVLMARFSPDGRRVVTTCRNGEVRLWDPATSQLIVGPLRHQDLVAHLRFSPDGSRLVTVSADGAARVWDARTGAPLTEPIPHLTGLATDSSGLSPDGSKVILLSRNTAQVCDLRSGKPVGSPMAQAARLLTAQFSPDGARVVLGSVAGVARIWDVETALPVSELLPHGGEVRHAEFSSDAQWLLTASSDGKVRLWEVLAAPAPIPRWLPDLAEAVVGQRLAENNVREPVSPGQLENLRQELTADASTNFYTRWAKWFFAPNATRTLSPSSTITVAEYVRRRIEEDTPESLREAVSLAPTNAVAQARLGLATLLAQIESLDHKGKPAEALALAEEGLLKNADSVGLWLAKGGLLARTGQPEEANQACTQALNLAGTNTHLLALCRNVLAHRADNIWGTRRVAESRAAFTKLLAVTGPTARECRDMAREGQFRAFLEGQLPHEMEDMWNLDRLLMLAERAVQLDPADWRNFQLLGMAQYRDRQFAAAAETFQAEGRLRGGTLSGRSLFFLAMTHQQLHEPDQARACFEKAWQWWQTTFLRLNSSLQTEFVALRTEAEQVLWPDLGKAQWKVVSASFEGKGGVGGEASRAIDGDPKTFWHTAQDDPAHPPPQEIIVDLGQRLDLTAFRYLPRQQGVRGLTDEYQFYLSTDGRNWKTPVVQGAFPDLKEYPAEQTVLFERPVTARYFRFVGLHAIEGNCISAAELGVVEDSKATDRIWNLNAQGKSLANSNRLDEALAAFQQAVELAGAHTNAFEQALSEARLNRSAVLRRLNRLTEAGVENCLARGIPPRAPETRPELVDLSRFYNGSLTRDMHNLEIKPGLRNDLSALPRGVQRLGGVEFDVRGLINLAGTFLSRSRMERYPSSVTGIPLKRKVAWLHCLHGTVWLVPPGTRVASYVLHFADGQERVFPILYGVEVRDWTHLSPEDGQVERAVVAWTGTNQLNTWNRGFQQLFRLSLQNPRPEVEVESLDFVSAMTDSAPFLIALTVE